MELIEKLYPDKETEFEGTWSNFFFFDPKISFLSHKSVKSGVSAENSRMFARQIQASYFPDYNPWDAERLFLDAGNRGAEAINDLIEEHNPNMYNFVVGRFEQGVNLYEFIRNTREQWIEIRKNKKPKDYTDEDRHDLRKVYERVRALGIAHLTVSIEQSPELVSSLTSFSLVQEWFKNHFVLSDKPEKSDTSEFEYVWEGPSGVKIYGDKKDPFRSRVKGLDDHGNIKYSSLMMKMLLQNIYPDKIKDHMGVEFVVPDQEAQNSILRYVVHDKKSTSRLEDFSSSRKKNGNPHSRFSPVKFIFRPPVAVPEVSGIKMPSLYQRVPVEVQLLTLEDYRYKTEHPDAKHEAYKKRQFDKFFQIIFPKQIYAPILEEDSQR
jgi:hypothetical protein